MGSAVRRRGWLRSLAGIRAWGCLALAVAGAPAWDAGADDALVLPPGLFRIYAVPAWTEVKATWDGEGVRHEIPEGSGRIRSFNLGMAVEYGVNRWLTAGIQLTPGANLSSSFDVPSSDPGHRDRANLDDTFDALAGFKIGLVGSTGKDPARTTGLFLSDSFRVALGLAVKFPVTTIDWGREARRYAEGSSYLVQAVDKHLVAPVFGLHVDWVVTRTRARELYVNLYGQYIPYLATASYAETSLGRYLDPSLAGVRIDHRYDLYLEVEPRFDLWVVPGILRAGFYLPVRDRIYPAPLLDGVDQHNAGYRVTVFPTLDLLTPSAGFPIELKIGYQHTAAGRNVLGTDSLVLVLRAMP